MEAYWPDNDMTDLPSLNNKQSRIISRYS